MDLEHLHGWTVLPEEHPTPSVSDEESVDELGDMDTETNKRKANASTPRVIRRPPKFPRISQEHAPPSQDRIANGFSEERDNGLHFSSPTSTRAPTHSNPRLLPKPTQNATPGPSKPVQMARKRFSLGFRRHALPESPSKPATSKIPRLSPTGHVSDDSEDFPVSFLQDYNNRHKHVKLKKRVKVKDSHQQIGPRRSPVEIIDITSDSEERVPSTRKSQSSSFSPPAAEIIEISSDTDDSDIAIRASFCKTPSPEIDHAVDRIHPDSAVNGPLKRLTSLETPKRQLEVLHPTHGDLGSSTPGSFNDEDLPPPSSDVSAPQPLNSDDNCVLEGSEEVTRPEDIPATAIPDSEHPKSPLPSQTSHLDALQVEVGMDNGHASDPPQSLHTSPPRSHELSDQGVNNFSTTSGSGTTPPTPSSQSPKDIPESPRLQSIRTTSTVVDPFGKVSIESLQSSNDNAYHEKWKPGSLDEGFDADADGLWASFYREHPSLRSRAWIRHVKLESQARSPPELPRPTTTLLLTDKVTSSASSDPHESPSQSNDVAPNDGGIEPSMETLPNVPQATAGTQKAKPPSLSSLRAVIKASQTQKASLSGTEESPTNITQVTHSQGVDLTPKSDEKRPESSPRPNLGYLRTLYKNSGLKSPLKSPDSPFKTDPESHPSQAQSLPTSPKILVEDLPPLDPPDDNNAPSDLSPRSPAGSLDAGGQADEADEQECLEMVAVTPTTDVEMSDLEALLLNGCSSGQTTGTSAHSPQLRHLSISSSRPSTPSTSTSGDVMALLKIKDIPQQGVEVLTWRDHRQKLIQALPSHLRAKDLPHAIEDNMNAMRPEFRSLINMRKVFETLIIENTVQDEPDAPPVRIFNEEDDEPHPDWEFHYSNQMWYGEGVPGPDLSNLVGCDCEGKCTPSLQPCKCSERQHSFYPGMEEDFIYDRQGTLIYHNVYIHECNILCSCDETCPNRVVQHGRRWEVNIVKTKAKGWGVFAGPKKIPGGTFVGIYAGELLTEADAHERGLKYDAFGRTYLLDIDFDRSISSKYTVDAYHAGNFTRFLNHSCEPNCNINAVFLNDGGIDKPLLAVFTDREIEPWEELCFSYFSSEDIPDDAGTRNNLPVHSKCYCGAPSCRGFMFI